MIQLEITTLDWVVLIGYLCIVTVVGLVAAFRVKDTSQYFLGNRRFGKWIMIAQSFGTGTHAEMPVSLAGAVYSVGLSGIWYQWKNMFATPFYWLIAPLFRRIRRTTLAEMVEDRYGPWMGAIYTAFALGFLTIAMASMLKGAAKVIGQAAGGHIPVDSIVVAMTVVFILYSFVGGLIATAWTDFLQGFLILALSFMLIPLGWGTVNGIEGIRQTLEASKTSLTTPQGIGLWFIFMLTLNGLIGIVAQPHMMAAVGTGRDEYTCRVGLLYGTFVKRFCTVGWAIVGLMVAAIVARGSFGVSGLRDPEEAFGFACRHFLFKGGVGLLIACVLAANMAGCSAFMVDSGALFTRNFYRRYLAPSRPDRHYLWVGRISGLAVALVGVVYAVLLIQRVLYSFLLIETMATFMGISVTAGVFWRRANRWGAISSLTVAMTANFVQYYLRHQRFDNWDPDVFFVSLVLGAATLIVVSLLTPPEPQAAMQSFYTRLQTPSDEAGMAEMTGMGAQPVPAAAATMSSVAVATPPTAPLAISDETDARVAAEGRQLILVNLFRLFRGAAGHGLRAYRTDLVGFGIGWALAAFLIGLVWLLFRG